MTRRLTTGLGSLIDRAIPCGFAVLAALTAATAPAAARVTILISDLHLGVGHVDESKQWHALEDFRWNADFAAFLGKIQQMSGAAGTTLVLNGDTFELWQSIVPSCPERADHDLGCSEAEVQARLARIIDQHKPTLHLLRDFAADPRNEVVIVPGNHDAGLLFPSAEAMLRPELGPNVVIPLTGYWLSADRRVLAEHGHEIGEEVNKMSGWPKPFKQQEDVQYLVCPWGERFVQAVFDEYELKYPAIDNISSNTAAVGFIMGADPPQSSALGIARFFKFLLLGTSYSQLTAFLGNHDGRPPKWDLTALRQKDRSFLLELTPPDAPYRQTARDALQSGALEISFADFSDPELQTLCDAQFARKREAPNDDSIVLCPTPSGDLNAVAQGVFSNPAKVKAKHLQARRHELQSLVPGWDGRFTLFVYSHTHTVEAPTAPLGGEPWSPHVVNTGAWQRTISEKEVKRRAQAGGNPIAALPAVDDLPACYSFVAVPDGSDVPSVLFWSRGQDGIWAIRATCPDDPGLNPAS